MRKSKFRIQLLKQLLLLGVCAFQVFLLVKFEVRIHLQSSKGKQEKNFGAYKILYLSGHQGTIEEITYAFGRHNIDYFIGDLNYFTDFDIFTRHHYVINEKIARTYLNFPSFQRLCATYDLIFIGDTIPMGWPFYRAATLNQCQAKIALQITQRYNYDIKSVEVYDQLMRNITTNPKVFWVPNNPYELFMLRNNSIYPPAERTFLIRPYGVSYYKGEKVLKKKTIIYAQLNVPSIKEALIKHRVSNSLYVVHTGQTYGGPMSALQHKIFVYFPYQFSTMKVYIKRFSRLKRNLSVELFCYFVF